MNVYQPGFCPQCNVQIAVRDTKGRWSSRKTNYREAHIVLENGTKIRTLICGECLMNPDLQKLMDSIIHDKSQATFQIMKDHIKSFGAPVKVERRV